MSKEVAAAAGGQDNVKMVEHFKTAKKEKE
jgi:hypothetical protein